MGFPFDRSNDPKATISYGRDHNFFANVTPTVAVGSPFNTDADVVITFSTTAVTFTIASGTTPVQYSFNGNTIHGDMGGPSGGITGITTLTFQNRVISKIWFKGAVPIRVEAW